MILIGSHAARFQGIDLGREPADVDVVVNDRNELNLFQNVRESVEHKGMFHGLLNGERAEIDATATDANFLMEDHILSPLRVMLHGLWMALPSPTVLYLIKRSHAGHDVHWEKTMHDLQRLKPYRPSVLGTVEREFYTLHKADCDARYRKRQKNFAVKNEEFFTSAVDRDYPHDWLHEAVKYDARPMFEYIKRDLSMAEIDHEMFDALPFEERAKAVREEAMVIALERLLIPGHEWNYKIAYRKALRHLLLNLSPDWFQDFMIDNYYHPAILRPDKDFYAEFQRAKENERTPF